MSLRCFYQSSGLLLVCLLIACDSHANRNLQDLQHIQADAKTFLLQSLKNSGDHADIRVQIKPLDPRLQLRQCDKPLTYATQHTSRNASNVTLKVRCEGIPPWSFFVSARVQRHLNIVIARHDLQRGDRIAADDIALERRDAAQLGSGVIETLSLATGKVIKRAIRKGDALRSPNLSAPQVISKGDHVSIKALAGNISVVTSGVALASGRIGQQIRIQNNQTERVIKALITAPGQVQIHL